MSNPGNPFAALDGYDLRHLVQHLDDRGRVADLHRLLGTETDTGGNAWYDAQNDVDDLATYVADVSRARDRAQASPLSALADKRLQLRYTLVLATLNSLADRVPTDLVDLFVESGLWSESRGLTIARSIPDEGRRATLLGVLAARAPAGQAERRWTEVLDAVEHIASERKRGAALASLGSRLPRPWHARAEALAASLTAADVRVMARLDFASECPDETTAATMLAAADGDRPAMSSPPRRLEALNLGMVIHARLHGIEVAWAALDATERDAVLTTLLPLFTPTQVAEAVRSLAATQGHTGRDDVRCALALRLVEIGDLAAALEIAQTVRDAASRTGAFVALASARAKAGEIDAALALADELARPAQKVAVLTAVAAAAPDAAWRPIVASATELLANLFNLRERGAAQAAIAECLAAHGEAADALAMAEAIELLPARIDALVALADTQAGGADAIDAIARWAQSETTLAPLVERLGAMSPDRRQAVLRILFRQSTEIADRASQVHAVVRAVTPAVGLDEARGIALLEVAARIVDAGERSAALARLAGAIPPAGFDPLTQLELGLANATLAGRVAASLLPRRVAQGLGAVEAIDAANAIADPEYRAKALVATEAIVPRALLAPLLERAANEASGIADPWTQVDVLADVAAKMSPEPAGRLWRRIVSMVEQLTDRYEKRADPEAASRVAHIVHRIAPQVSATVLAQLAAAVGRLSADNYRDEARFDLVARAVALGDIALATACADEMKPGLLSFRARLSIAAMQPEAPIALPRLAESMALTDPAERAQAFLELAEQDQPGPAWQVAILTAASNEIDAMRAPLTSVDATETDYTEPERLMLDLARRWTALDLDRAAEAWNEALVRLARKSRPTALSLLPEAARILPTASDEDTGTVVADMVLTVCRWWP